MPRIEPGVYPVATALNLANSGKRVSVSVTLPDGTVADVRALALNNITSTACQVFVDESGNATVSNPSDTGRVLSQRRGRFEQRRPSGVPVLLRPVEASSAIAWWQFTWQEIPFGTFDQGVISADPDPLEFYTIFNPGTGRAFIQNTVAIVNAAAAATVTITATKITTAPTSSLFVYSWFNRDEATYPAPIPNSYPSPGDAAAFLLQLPLFDLGGFDDLQTSGSSTTITVNVPAGRSVIQVAEDSGLTVTGTAPLALWSITASVA